MQRLQVADQMVKAGDYLIRTRIVCGYHFPLVVRVGQQVLL